MVLVEDFRLLNKSKLFELGPLTLSTLLLDLEAVKEKSLLATGSLELGSTGEPSLLLNPSAQGVDRCKLFFPLDPGMKRHNYQ